MKGLFWGIKKSQLTAKSAGNKGTGLKEVYYGMICTS